MEYRQIVSAILAVSAIVDGFSLLAKGYKPSGVLKLIAGLLFAGATVIAFLRVRASSDTLLWAEWAFYLVGFIFFIIGVVIQQKAIKSDK